MRRLRIQKTLVTIAVLACTFAAASHAQGHRPPGARTGFPRVAAPATRATDEGALLPLTEPLPGAPASSFIAAPFAPTVSLPEDADWEGWLTPGLARVNPLFVEYHDKLYLSGVGAAGHAAGNLMTWDGSHFEAAPALPVPSATAMTVWNDHLVVATNYGNRILILNGTAWDTLASLDRTPQAMTVYAGDLVIGGFFTKVNGQPANRVARWNGSAWSAFGSGLAGTVSALAVHAGQLVAAGSFSPNNVLGWNAALGVWQPLGAAFNFTVQSLASDGVTLYAAGTFFQSGNYSGANARWDGVQWLAVGPTFYNYFNEPCSVAIWNGGAVFTRPMNGGFLAFWDGSTLSALGDSLGTGGNSFVFGVRQIGAWGTKLVVSGLFHQQGTVPVNGIVIHDGLTWSAPLEPWDDQMLSPEGGSVGDLITWNGKLLFGGEPQIAADHDHFVPCSGFCAWDGTHWSAMGTKYYTPNPKFFGTYQGDLVAVGESVQLGYVGRWNGSSWSTIGTIGTAGMSPPQYGYAAQEFHGDLYVASVAGDRYEGGLARWNGVNWQSLGTTLSYEGEPYNASGISLCLLGDSLVVGGQFDHAGSLPAGNIAVWDGAAWHAMGDGLTGDPNTVGNEIDAVAIWNGHLVAGGAFSNSGIQPVQGAAIWDGVSWQQLGTNVIYVRSFCVADGVLFASGEFRLQDGTEVHSVARWTGSDWHILGSGTAGYPYPSIGVYDGYLYESGSGLVNGHVSHGLSRILLSATVDVPRTRQAPTRLKLAVSPNPARGSVALSFSSPMAGHVLLTLLDVGGREVARPVDREFEPGPHQVAWPTAEAPGIYFARLQSPAGVKNVRFVVLGR